MWSDRCGDGAALCAPQEQCFKATASVAPIRNSVHQLSAAFSEVEELLAHFLLASVSSFVGCTHTCLPRLAAATDKEPEPEPVTRSSEIFRLFQGSDAAHRCSLSIDYFWDKSITKTPSGFSLSSWHSWIFHKVLEPFLRDFGPSAALLDGDLVTVEAV